MEVQQILMDKPTLAELQENVRTIKWEELGVQFGLDDTSLVAIRTENKSIDDCRRGMFRLWLFSHPNPTRKQLLDALKKKSVAELQIASAYENYLNQLPQATTTLGKCAYMCFILI